IRTIILQVIGANFVD
ncbi:hypothetical protein D039_0847B, partial [Vibrio parahaemolyticus EKP-028]